MESTPIITHTSSKPVPISARYGPPDEPPVMLIPKYRERENHEDRLNIQARFFSISNSAMDRESPITREMKENMTKEWKIGGGRRGHSSCCKEGIPN